MKRFATNTSNSIQNGIEVLTDNLKTIQDGPEENIVDVLTDLFDDGIIYTNSPVPFNILDNGDGTFTIGQGIGYKNGYRIEIASTDTTVYNSGNPTTTTADGIGGYTLTPISSGCVSIPIPTSTTYAVGIKFLQTCDPTKYSTHPITSQRLFYYRDNGYEIELVSNSSLIEGLYLGTVVRGTGTVLTINMSSNRVYATIKTNVNRTATDISDNIVSNQKIQNLAVTGAKIASAVAGNGLSKDISGNLQVNVDDSTIEIATDTLAVKNGGITSSKLDSNIAVTANITADNFRTSTGTTGTIANNYTQQVYTCGSHVYLGVIIAVSTTNSALQAASWFSTNLAGQVLGTVPIFSSASVTITTQSSNIAVQNTTGGDANFSWTVFLIAAT